MGRQILRRGQLTIKLLAEQVERESKDKPDVAPKSSDANPTTDMHSTASSEEPALQPPEEELLAESYASLDNEPQAEESVAESNLDSTEAESMDVAPVVSAENQDSLDVASPPISPDEPSASSAEPSASEIPAPVDPLLATFSTVPVGKSKSSKLEKKRVPKPPAKQLSPRQRRRKWLRSILQRYSKMRTQLNRIGHYQALMLGRGQRSQIISIKIDYDRNAMTQLAREALCPGPHPLNSLLMEVSEDALQKLILPRLEHDVFSEMEELAHYELTEMAVRHLQDMLQQRRCAAIGFSSSMPWGPRRPRSLSSIRMGMSTSPANCRLSAVARRRRQNVATLGQWIHQYRVSLVAISNGNTRRYLIHTVNELMKQSSDGDLRWTLVDRTGADAYCDTRQALQELPKIAKRFRAAVGWAGDFKTR